MVKQKNNKLSFKEIPIIDISPLYHQNKNLKLLRKVGDEIRYSCKNVGFFYIINHQVSQSHMDSLIFLIQNFFNLSLKEKMKIHINNSDVFRGYTPLGKELTNNQYDWHECVDFGPDYNQSDTQKTCSNQLLGPNQWPEKPKKLKKVLETHRALMISLGKKVTQGLSISLGLPINYFEPFINKSHSFMRISNYPPYKNNKKENIGNGIGSHIDYGFLTILLQDKIGGLEIKTFNDEWFSAPIIPGTFLINVGHMIQRWTNDYYMATIHRVIPPKNKNRCSLPFFFEPNLDSIVAPLKQFCSKDNLPRYDAIHFGDYLEKTFKTSYSSLIV
tara:strand:- start:332 stop:1321 length:990 start_codon:yes stop_codon:yes gene_type:complete